MTVSLVISVFILCCFLELVLSGKYEVKSSVKEINTRFKLSRIPFYLISVSILECVDESIGNIVKSSCNKNCGDYGKDCGKPWKNSVRANCLRNIGQTVMNERVRKKCKKICNICGI